MKSLFIALILTSFVLVGSAVISGQTPSGSSAQTSAPDIGITPTLALGDVTAIDAANNKLTLKTNDGEIIVILDDKTEFKKTQPGARDLKTATVIARTDIIVGDRIIARGKVADDRKSIPARQVIVMTKADIAQKQERDRADWQRRGIVGRIVSLNPETKEINLSMRSREGDRPIIIAAAGDVMFRRYAPDSVKFSDAKPSSFAELKVSDQLRALGNRSEDGTHFTPEEIVSGSFRMVGGPVTAVNAAKNEITISNLQTSQPITVVINNDSILRRIPAEMATMIAQRRAQAAAGGGPAAAQGQGSGAGANGGAGAGVGGARGRGAPDFDEMIERLPQVAITDLKAGDVIAVSSTTGADPTRVTAIKLVAGIEALMTRPQGPAQGGGQSPSLSVPGLDNIGGP